MTLASTGIGSMPGGELGREADNGLVYAEMQRIVLGETSIPHLVELPGRGAISSMTGRTLGLIDELGFDLQPAGWRLSSRGVDQRRASSLIAQDLDVVSQIGVSGTFKVQVCGPWTLAATVEKPRGDLLVSDVGARRDVAAALAAAVATHIGDLRRRLPGVDLLVQVDEPAIPAVMAGKLKTASGFGRHRSVDPPAASAGLEPVLAAIADAGAMSVVHCCASEVPVGLIRGAGAGGISVDLAALAAASYDGVAEALEAGEWVFLGAVESTDPTPDPTPASVNGRVQRFLDMMGLEPTERLVVTPRCGLAGASVTWARTALRLSGSVNL